MKPILLDTCALLWWTLDGDKLSDSARHVAQSFEKDGVLVSAISVWEIGVKIKNNKLDIGMPIEAYAEKLNQVSGLTIVPVDVPTLLVSLNLAWHHRDPADRIIVASAHINQCSIMTNDKAIADFYEWVVF